MFKDKHGYLNGTVKPDVVIHMNEKTFDDLSSGRVSGFFAWLTGRAKIVGDLTITHRFDDLVVRKYNPDEGYSKTERAPH